MTADFFCFRSLFRVKRKWGMHFRANSFLFLSSYIELESTTFAFFSFLLLGLKSIPQKLRYPSHLLVTARYRCLWAGTPLNHILTMARGTSSSSLDIKDMPRLLDYSRIALILPRRFFFVFLSHCGISLIYTFLMPCPVRMSAMCMFAISPWGRGGGNIVCIYLGYVYYVYIAHTSLTYTWNVGYPWLEKKGWELSGTKSL